MAVEDDVRELPEKDWPDALSREVRRIRRWPAIELGSVSVYTDGAGRVRIGFRVWTERRLEPGPTPIEDVEPITLIYGSANAVGLNAPAVWSDRADFPRDIGHINPTPPGHPASLCLARAGLQPIYDRYGVDGVLDRLMTWLHDAKTGQLMQDGWEPVPMGEDQDVRGGFFSIGFFQELALNQDAGVGWRCGVARLLSEDLGGKVVFLSPELDLSDDARVQAACKQVQERPKDKGVAAYIPWVFAWSDRAAPIERQLFGVWNNYGEVEAGLKGTGIEAQLPAAIMNAVLRLTNPTAPGGRPVGLLLGVWRPVPISDQVFGMAHAAQARRLEIRAYLLHCEEHPKNPIDPAVKVRQLLGLQIPSREMLAFTSGVSADAPVALLGYGALGSCIADFLLRAGIPKIAAVDNEDLAPHNLARHNATVENLYARKAAHLGWLAGKITFPGGDIEGAPIDCDVTGLSDEKIATIAGRYPLLIDATASEQVRRRLSAAALPAAARLVRAEIFDGGRLGALFVTGGENGPNLIDLYYALCLRAVEDKAVEAWLRSERAAGASSEELMVGMGCASATTRMPKYMVAQHASAFMPAIMAAANGKADTGIGINPLGPDGAPAGWCWFNYGGPVTVLRGADAPGWAVRLSPDAAGRLAELRIAHGNDETGGYLYGGYDFVLTQIYVVAVSDVPPGTRQSPAAIDLGPAGRTPLERRIDRRAGGKLARVGTWHSHPRSGPDMSRKDRRTMERFRDEDRENGVPTLLVIASPEGDSAHLWI